jgi:dihydroflavonol-4-reductase
MNDISSHSPILITGATGYVGSWVARLLLEQGVTVHVTVRDLNQKSRYQHLIDLDQSLPGNIRFFQADLLKEGSFSEAMKNTKAIFHIASPFKLAINDPQTELIDPALQGTKNVLHQANQTPSVKKVILTSSCAAMFGDNVDLDQLKNKTLTEECWNTSSTLTHNPYSYSKTLAEKAAWDIAKQQDQWQMIAINPCLVMGPSLSPYSDSESLRLLRQLKDGSLRPGVANIGMGIVDVRDVALAHINALTSSKAQGRHIICGHSSSFLEIAQILHQKYGTTHPIPNRALPKILCWLFGPIMLKGITRKYIQNNINIAWKANTEKSISDLDMNYRPLDTTLFDAFESI